MGVCLGKLSLGARAVDTQPHPRDTAGPSALEDPAAAKTSKPNHVAPQPSPPEKEPAVERPALPSRDDASKGGPPRPLQRSLTATSRSSTKRATFAITGSTAGGGSVNLLGHTQAAAAAASLSTTATATATTSTASDSPNAKARHMSVRPELHRIGSSRRVDNRRGKKRVDVTLDVLLKDERARVGLFKFLAGTPAESDAIPEESPLEAPARLKRRASRLVQREQPTVDYREDCVLFWLEISDLLKIPPGGSFHLGLMQDLFDVYVTKHAPRLLPMVSSSEREPLAQYLQDRNTDRALLAFKMLLLDVLEIVTAAFDEYVRCETKLGYVYATRNESMRNVLARLAKVNLGLASHDRRAQLNDILNTPAVCKMFREFLQERNSVENLLFIIDALAFEDLVNSFESEHEKEKLSESDQASRNDYCLRQAQKIFNKYIRYGSKAEICLSGSVKAKLLQSVVEYPLGSQVFNDAVLLCSAELVHSHLDIFYRSHAYIQYQIAKREAAKNHHSTMQRRRSNTASRRNSVRTSGDVGEDSGMPALSDILNSVGVNYFRDFLKEQSAENTLLFYKEVEQFQLLPHGQKHYIQIKARRIFDRYVRRGAKLEIELPMDVRRDILFKLSAPSEFTFVDALKYVVNMWEAQYLPKLKTHKLYKEMLTAMETTPLPSAAVASAVDLATRRESVPVSGPAGVPMAAVGAAPISNSASDWVDITKITLREFLELEFLRKYFRQFLEKEQCVNELHFYFEIATFQQLPTSDYLTRQAKKLYNRFCDPQSRECVVLREDLKAELLQSLAKPSPAMFRKTQDEIFGFFQSTLFPKFQQSEMYRSIQLTHSQLKNARQAAMGLADRGVSDVRRGGMDAIGNAGTRGMDSPPNRGNRRSLGAISSLPELADESVSVAMILENPETRALFLLFAEEIFCTESIYFWLDCNEYKDIPHRNYLKLRAQKIYRKYISGRAKLQVNLEGAITKEIVKNLDDPSRTLFVVAQRSITKMLERDTLPKFRKSKHFQPCLLILRAALAKPS